MLLDTVQKLKGGLDAVGPAAVEHQGARGPERLTRGPDERDVVVEVRPSGPQPSLSAGYPALAARSAMRRTSSTESGITSLA